MLIISCPNGTYNILAAKDVDVNEINFKVQQTVPGNEITFKSHNTIQRFPIRLAFALTINKKQRKSITICSLNLEN